MIGFDMDHTLVRYYSENFEEMAFGEIIKKLIELKNYPEEITKFKFDFSRVIRGLVFDCKKGNLLKLNLYGKVKSCYHGMNPLPFKEMRREYRGPTIDFSDQRYFFLDTFFSVSTALLFAQLVDFKDSRTNINLPTYEDMLNHIFEAIDLSHKDGSLKGKVRDNLKKYIIQDPQIVSALEKFKNDGKLLGVITNSDFHYTKLLLDYTINPFLQGGINWSQFFDVVVTVAEKPLFFTDQRPFLYVDKETGLMSNLYSNLQKGNVYQGGNFKDLENSFGFSGDEILYMGDHIYGDVLAIKKNCHWRTGIIVEELDREVLSLQKGKHLIQQIDELMSEKIASEKEYFKKMDNVEDSREICNEIRNIDEKVSKIIVKYQQYFNPYWGPLMRAGQEESFLTKQIEKYACIYMSKVSQFNHYSPKHYFRPKQRPLPHEE